MIGPVDLPDDLLDGPVWSALCDLADGFRGRWSLIGARMVEMHGRAVGRFPRRLSADLDVLFDAKVVGSRPSDAAGWLEANGFVMDGISADGIGHRFVRDGVYVDVLAPDRLGRRADLRVAPGARTVAVPAGRRVLNHLTTVEVSVGGRRSTLPLPTLAGALVAKSAAVSVDDAPRNQRVDLAFLYSLVADPVPIKDELGPGGRRVLARREELADRGHEAWRQLGAEADDAYAAFRFLTTSSRRGA